MYNILLIEDDIIWRSKICSQLTECGFTDFTAVADLDSASEILKKSIPDLLISDIMLEEKLTYELLLQNEYAKIPTLFITSSTNVEYFDKSAHFTNCMYLVKPFHALSLQAAIRSVMKNYVRSLPLRPEGIALRGRHSEKVILSYKEIIFIRAQKNYCYFKTKEAVFLKKISLTAIAEDIGDSFIQIHKCYLVNKPHILHARIDNMHIETSAGPVPIGRKYKDNLLAHFLNSEKQFD